MELACKFKTERSRHTENQAIGSAEDLPPRFRAESARFCVDPADFSKIIFRRTSGERSADSAGLRADTGGSARSPPRTGGRVHSKNVRRQKLILNHCSSRKNFRTGRLSAAEILVGSGSGLGLGFYQIRVMVKVRVRDKIRVWVRVP